jgi:hypothetical protein
MNENCKRWVEALESGRYKQGKGFLEFEGSYCCLGVLCDLHIQTVGGVDIVSSSELGKNLIPREDILDWAGIDRTTADVLANGNDDGATFTELAQKIRERAK